MARHKATGPRVETSHDGTRYEVVGLDRASPLFKWRHEADIWLRDQVARLPASRQPRPRSCLTCGQTFVSQHFGHRMCNDCRHLGGSASMGISSNAIRKVRRASGA